MQREPTIRKRYHVCSTFKAFLSTAIVDDRHKKTRFENQQFVKFKLLFLSFQYILLLPFRLLLRCKFIARIILKYKIENQRRDVNGRNRNIIFFSKLLLAQELPRAGLPRPTKPI